MMVTKMLVLVLLLGSGMVTCRDTSPDLTSAVIQYSDTCKYSDLNVRCGDQCTTSSDYCYCGNTSIDFIEDSQHAPTLPTSPVPCPECAYILTSGVMAILSASSLRTRCLRTAGRNITETRL